MDSPTLHFIIEDKIPFAKGLFESLPAELRPKVTYLPPQGFTPDSVKDADALMVRTRTQCNAALLQDSRCQMVATATIGTDHIDMPWCRANGIEVANAPGCNAPAVAQYVFASLLAVANRPLSQYTIGIVGVGNVGKTIQQWAKQLDMRVLLNDPPRQAAEGGNQWSSLEDIARETDIITFHTPLDATTQHLADSAFMDSLQRFPILINTARGPVVDNAALLQALEDGKVSHAIIDCWEGEPNISANLLQLCDIATPHIAGYSQEGKIRGTRMAVDAICRHFGLPYIPMQQTVAERAASTVNPNVILRSYDPLADTMALKADISAFEQLRNGYALRHEVSAGKID